MNQGLFISGTDTNIGKTIVSSLLVSAIRSFSLSGSPWALPRQHSQNYQPKDGGEGRSGRSVPSLRTLLRECPTGQGRSSAHASLLLDENRTLQTKVDSSLIAGYFKPLQTGTDLDRETVADLAGLYTSWPATETSLHSSAKDLAHFSLPQPVYSFPEPLAPATAAALHGVTVDIHSVVQKWQNLLQTNSNQLWIVEGAGGLLVPINEHQTIRDLVLALKIPLLIVASTRLGTMNHTLLTVEAAKKVGIPIAGIVFVGERNAPTENIIAKMSQVPIITRIPFLEQVTPAEIQRLGPAYFTDFLHRYLKNETDVSIQSTPSTYLKKTASAPMSTAWAPSEHSEERAPATSPENSAPWALLEKDRKWIWHPFSQHGLNQPIQLAESGRGAYIKLGDGREILDGISSWWVNIHGHSHPAIVEAIRHQAATMDHVIFTSFTHSPAVSLAEAILKYPSIEQAGLGRAFFSDNGSTAVEVALKMAYQFYINRGEKPRNRFIALNHSYHGDTLGAMSVSEPTGFHSTFRPLMTTVDFVEPGDLLQLENLLNTFENSHSAFIFEPYIQGSGGMKMYDRGYLDQAVALCKSRGIVTIADEVFTGFFRTGKCFAFEHGQFHPDLICLSKGITGGFLPLGLTLAHPSIYDSFVSKKIETAFLHGHSYTANPIVCAAAVASWKLLQTPECHLQIKKICDRTSEHIQNLKAHPKVLSARSLGTVGAVELKNEISYLDAQQKVIPRALEQNVLLRPLGNVLYTVPSYCMTVQEIDRIYSVILDLVDYI